MSSIRKRLSQLWKRSSEKETPKENEQGPVARRDSISSLDSGYSSNTSQRAIDSTKQTTPRNLHKVASTTFQSFSDTIRSKTRVFYVSPENADTKSVDCTKDTPRSHQPRSPVLFSSLMSQEGHGSLDYQLGSGRKSPTLITMLPKSQDITPTINVKIPDSFLADSKTSEDSTHMSYVEMSYQVATPATLKPYGPRQLWPAPIDVALQQFSKIDLSAASVPRSPMIDDPHADSSEDFMYDSAMFDPDSRAPPSSSEEPNLTMEDDCNCGNFQDERIVTDPKSSALGSGSLSRSMPHRDAAMKLQKPGNSLFFEGDQVCFQGTSVTSSFLEQFQKEVHDAKVASEALKSSFHPNAAEMTSLHPEKNHRPIFYRTVSHKTGLKDLIASSDSPHNHEGQEHIILLSSSSVYKDDKKSEAPSPEVPAMGSRREWDKARADRYYRYSAIRSLDDDEKTEEDSEFGLELEKTPARRPLEDALRALVEPDTDTNGQGFDLVVANNEMADSQEKTTVSPRQPILHAVENTSTNLSEQSLGLSEGSQSSLALSDLYEEFKACESSPSEPPMANYFVDAEAALHRLRERNQDWTSLSSYDSEDELYIQYERPGDVTIFPAASAICKSAGTEKLDPGSTLSSHPSEIFDDTCTENRRETNPYEYYGSESDIVWSSLSETDVPDSTKFLKGNDDFEENDECIKGILSENECFPLDESPVYLNPSPFPDLKKSGEDEDSPSSIIAEDSRADQVDRVAFLHEQEANPSPASLNMSVNAYEGFWADLVLELKDYSLGYHGAEQNAQNQGAHEPKGSRTFYDDLMKELDDMRIIKHELNDPDRAFNAARLPRFNPTPPPAPPSLVGRAGPRRGGQKKMPEMIGWSWKKPQNRRDRTNAAGRRGVWWASDVEYIEKPGPVLSETRNGVGSETNRPNLFLGIPQE